MRLTVEPYGEDQFSGVIRRLRQSAEDPRPVLREVADDFRAVMSAQFSTSGGFSGGWAPSTPGYRARKGGGAPGVVTGVMRRSLTTRGAGSHQRVTRDEMTVGSLATARGRARHTDLYDRGRGGQVARPLVPPARVLARRWTPILARVLDTGGRGFSGVIR